MQIRAQGNRQTLFPLSKFCWLLQPLLLRLRFLHSLLYRTIVDGTHPCPSKYPNSGEPSPQFSVEFVHVPGRTAKIHRISVGYLYADIRRLPITLDTLVMAYPLDSRGLDPSMQRIIEAAEAGNDDELLPNASLGRPAVPDAQAPLTSSRHINNGSSLQDAYQASPPVHSSLSRQPIQPTQLDYHVQPYSKSSTSRRLS